MDKYVNKETTLNALSGPFEEVPFDWLRTNPCMTRPKKDSALRRVILDLSFPVGNSVNSSDACKSYSAPRGELPAV